MKFIAEMDVMPHKELLDPHGRTVANNMRNLNLQGVEDIGISRYIEIQLNADLEAQAREKVDTACQKLLINPIMEGCTFTFKAAK